MQDSVFDMLGSCEMTFIEFKKQLLDAKINLPKFSKIIKVRK